MDDKDTAEPPTSAVRSGVKSAITDVDVVRLKASGLCSPVHSLGLRPPGPGPLTAQLSWVSYPSGMNDMKPSQLEKQRLTPGSHSTPITDLQGTC